MVAVTTQGWVPTAEVLESAASPCSLGSSAWTPSTSCSARPSTIRPGSGTRRSHLELPFGTPYETVLDDSDGIAWSKWFVGGRTNLAAMCVDRWLARRRGERRLSGTARTARAQWTIEELHAEAEGLCGLLATRRRAGDTVALLMPMIPDAVAGMLAVAKLGADSVPLFSGFGVAWVKVRLEDSSVAASSPPTAPCGAASRWPWRAAGSKRRTTSRPSTRSLWRTSGTRARGSCAPVSRSSTGRRRLTSRRPRSTCPPTTRC